MVNTSIKLPFIAIAWTKIIAKSEISRIIDAIKKMLQSNTMNELAAAACAARRVGEPVPGGINECAARFTYSLGRGR